MTNDYRAMCAELLVLAEESISYRAQVSEAVNLIDRARALLVQPEAEGPTDEELLEAMSQAMRDDLAQVSRLSAQQAGVPAGVYRTTLNVRALRTQRQPIAPITHSL